VTNDDELAEIRNEVDELQDKVNFVEKGDLVEAVTNDVVNDIKRRLFD